MNMYRFLFLAGLGIGLGTGLGACEAGGGSDGSADSTTDGATDDSTSADTDPEPIGWIELGWGDGTYVPLSDGDDFPIVRGGQGSEMFPLPMRGAEFFLPENPTTWMNELGPLVDVNLDIEGYNDGIGGHFKRVANYRVDWTIEEDGTYSSTFVPIIMPDGITPEEIDGLPVHVYVRLRPHEQPAIETELDLVVRVLVDDSEG